MYWREHKLYTLLSMRIVMGRGVAANALVFVLDELNKGSPRRDTIIASLQEAIKSIKEGEALPSTLDILEVIE
jgi:hypothetical protein